MKHLVLFDVDGTLIWSDGSGKAAMRSALINTYGTAGPIDKYSFAGRTDREAVRDLMQAADIPEKTIWKRFDALGIALTDELYQRLLSGEHDVRPCPGAPALVAALDMRSDILLGLVTGNMQQTAHLKLRAASYSPELFVVGGYGDESAVRSELVQLAIDRAQALTEARFTNEQVVIIGDTPADMQSGVPFGARGIAVLTGSHSREQLLAGGAFSVHDSLSDLEAVMDTIIAPPEV